MQSEGHDSEGTTADFGKLLFLASVSSRVSFADVIYSLGPTDEDIKMAGEGPTIAATTREAAVRDSNEESAGKDPVLPLLLAKLLLVCPAMGMLFPRLFMMHITTKNLQVW